MKTTGKIRRTRAFTLVELLVVISVIALLLTVTLPALTAAKDSAKEAKTRALIRALADGVEMFRADDVVGSTYPPSYIASAAEPNIYDNTGQFNMFGAQSLGAAVIGPMSTVVGNRPGTAGFPSISHAGVAAGQSVRAWTDSHKDNLRGPFVDRDSIEFVKLAVTDTSDKSPVILDPWKRPILYFKANRAGTQTSNIYDWTHNAPYLKFPEYKRGDLNSDVDFEKAFCKYLRDPLATDLAGRNTKPDEEAIPYNRDSFIIMSAGKDGRYLSPTDISNMKKSK